MSLRDRVKLIFKKYGFTVFAVVSAVGLVIGVIVNNLKKGLTSLGKGVGGALKTIGKKLERFCPVWLALLQVSSSKQQVKRLVFSRNTLGY